MVLSLKIMLMERAGDRLDSASRKGQNRLLLAMWLSWLERGTHNAEVGGSSPPIATIILALFFDND